MKRIFIFPTEGEAAPFRRRVPDAEVVISGVGAAATATCITQVLKSGADSLILAGIAGSYVPEISCGAVVAVSGERMSGMADATWYHPSFCPKALPAVKSNTVAVCGADADGAQIENMEGAVFMALCADTDVQFCEVRAISNMVGARPDTWYKDLASDNLAAVLEKIFFSCDDNIREYDDDDDDDDEYEGEGEGEGKDEDNGNDDNNDDNNYKKNIMEKGKRNKLIIWSIVLVLAIFFIVLLFTIWWSWFEPFLRYACAVFCGFLLGWIVGHFGIKVTRAEKKKKNAGDNGINEQSTGKETKELPQDKH